MPRRKFGIAQGFMQLLMRGSYFLQANDISATLGEPGKSATASGRAYAIDIRRGNNK
jgi:hypothetical protein